MVAVRIYVPGVVTFKVALLPKIWPAKFFQLNRVITGDGEAVSRIEVLLQVNAPPPLISATGAKTEMEKLITLSQP